MISANKKIALCISGQPRFFEEAYPYIKKNILDCNLDIDVFLHCWYDKDQVGKRFAMTSDTTREEGNGLLIEAAPEKLKSLYRPVSMLVEPQENFSDKVKPEYELARDKTNPFATFSMWTSIKRCNDLKSRYEAEHNFIYDTVIRCRYDLKIESPITVNDVSKSTIYTSGHSRRTDIVEDIIFFGTSNSINVVSQMSDALDRSFNTLQKWNNEALFATHCSTQKIAVERHPEWKFTLARGKRTLADTVWYTLRRVRAKLHL